MSSLLKLYSYNEFISEYGEIHKIDTDFTRILTTKSVAVYLTRYYKRAIDERIIKFDINTLKHSYFVLLEEENYDDSGYRYQEKKWFLFTNIISNIFKDSDHFILFKNVSYLNVVRRRNFCRLSIQCEDNLLLELDRAHIHTFEYNGEKSYTIKTDKGTFHSKYTSRSFISAFAKIMSISSTGSEEAQFHYVLYMDGSFERLLESPNTPKVKYYPF